MRYIFVFLFSVLILIQCANAEEKTSENQSYAEKILEANKQLDIASEFAKKINSEEVRIAVIGALEACKECLGLDFLTQNFESAENKVAILNENIDEILADCDQEDIKFQIAACIEKMAE